MRTTLRTSSLISLALSTQNREAALLRATTDLFVHGGPHGRDEIQRFEELAIHFLPKVLVSDRAYVAECLADRADAPAGVLVYLTKDLIEVAAPILKRAKVLSTDDFLAIIAETGPLHHRMIAARGDLSSEVEEALRLRQDAVTVALLDREPIVTPESTVESAEDDDRAEAFEQFSGMEGEAERDDDSVLSRRLEGYAPSRVELHSAVDGFLDLDSDGRVGVLASLSEQRIRPPRLSPREHFDVALNAAQKGGQIPGLARAKRKEALIDAFAEGLSLDRDLVERMVDDPSGEPLVLLVKAIGLSDADARQVLLLANPAIGLAVQTFFRLADLHASMEPALAEAMIAAWRGDADASPEHMPHLADADGVRRRGQPERQAPPRDADFLRRRRV